MRVYYVLTVIEQTPAHPGGIAGAKLENHMSKTIQINGVAVAVPEGAVAYKYADPTEGPRWIYDEADLVEISNEDPSLLVSVDQNPLENYADPVVVERMPEWLRDSHRAAGNWGVYPHNGAERVIVERAEHDDENEYDRILRPATAEDFDRYEAP